PSKNRATSPIKPRRSSAENRCASVESFCGAPLGRRFLGGSLALSSSVTRRKVSLPITNVSVEMSVRFDILVSIGWFTSHFSLLTSHFSLLTSHFSLLTSPDHRC